MLPFLAWLLHIPPPPPCVLTWACPNAATLCFRIFGLFFLNHRFCDSNPIENMVCLFVQAAGRVIMGVKVLVYLSLQSSHCCLFQPTVTGKPTGVAVCHCITWFQTQLFLTTFLHPPQSCSVDRPPHPQPESGQLVLCSVANADQLSLNVISPSLSGAAIVYTATC